MWKQSHSYFHSTTGCISRDATFRADLEADTLGGLIKHQPTGKNPQQPANLAIVTYVTTFGIAMEHSIINIKESPQWNVSKSDIQIAFSPETVSCTVCHGDKAIGDTVKSITYRTAKINRRM